MLMAMVRDGDGWFQILRKRFQMEPQPGRVAEGQTAEAGMWC